MSSWSAHSRCLPSRPDYPTRADQNIWGFVISMSSQCHLETSSCFDALWVIWAVGNGGQNLIRARSQAGKRGASCEPGAEPWEGKEPPQLEGFLQFGCIQLLLLSFQVTAGTRLPAALAALHPQKPPQTPSFKAGDNIRARLHSLSRRGWPALPGARVRAIKIRLMFVQGDLNSVQLACLEMSRLFVLKGISWALICGGYRSGLGFFEGNTLHFGSSLRKMTL